jgi:hypothetical protein
MAALPPSGLSALADYSGATAYPSIVTLSTRAPSVKKVVARCPVFVREALSSLMTFHTDELGT